MRAGTLRRRVNIDEPVDEQNETGEYVTVWTERDILWASIEPLRGREAAQSKLISATVDTRIMIRWSPETDRINAKWRLRHKVRDVEVIYNIDYVAHLELGHRTIELMCTSGVNRG